MCETVNLRALDCARRKVQAPRDGVPAVFKRARAAGIKFGRPSGRRTVSRKCPRSRIDWTGEGDTLLVTRIDRLARSTRDLLNTLHTVTERGAVFKSLVDPCETIAFARSQPR